MLLAVLPVQSSTAPGAYSEKLNVFIAGSSAYWYFTFTGVNGSSRLSQFEGSPGLSSYTVTAIMTTGWKSDFQVFGPQGYNLLPVPFIPSQGLFLTLSSDSYSDALTAAGRLDSYFASSFVSLSNESGSFEFYSPVSFTAIVPATLLKLIPSSMGGFAAAITPSSFDSTPSPFVTLQGTKGSSEFSHSIVVGSISNNALNSQGKPNLVAYFGSTVTSLTAAKQSLSSTIQVRALDGLISSNDKATVVNDTAHFTGSYNLTVAATKKVFGINTTVLQQPLQLLAARYVDVGVLRTGQPMSVTISLTNLSNETALNNVTFTDNWWSQSLFRLVRGSSTFSLGELNATKSVTPTYVLQYIGNATGRVTIPAEEVHFSYTMGGSTFKGHSWLNPITVSLGEDVPVIFAYIAPIGSPSQPVGATQSLDLVVKNVGTRAATSVVANGQPIISGLAADGGNATVKISQTASGLLDTNLTKSYLVTYSDPQGETLNATTNLLPLEFTHSGMKLGLATVVVGANLAPLKAGSNAINLTLSFTVSNIGSNGISNFVAKVPIPNGLGCGVVKGAGICASGILRLNYTTLPPQAIEKSSMRVNVTDFANYFVPPLSFQGTTAGINCTGKSNAFALPTGYVLTKQFNPSLLFSGVSSTVTLLALNRGPFYIYNASVGSTVDTFDSLSPLAVPSVANGSISPRGNLSKTYIVNAETVYGNHSSSPISSSFFFGGTQFSLEGLGPYVPVYQPLNATISTTPSSPTEGKEFNFDLTIHNPSAVNVSSVLFTVPVPSGLTLSQLTDAMVSNGNLTISVPLLMSHSEFSATGVAVASSGSTIPLKGASLTFVYQGTEIKGFPPQQGIVVAENATLRYLIPIAVALVALLAVAFYVRRMAVPTVPASPK